MRRTLALAFLVVAPPLALVAQGRPVAADSQAVADVVTRLHTALAAGDSSAALATLADDIEILEAGGVETLTQYRRGHLAGDIAFSRAVPSRRSPLHVRVIGDVAWVTSTSVTEGQFRERAVNSAGAELAVVVRGARGWQIRAVHWSSRQRRQ